MDEECMGSPHTDASERLAICGVYVRTFFEPSLEVQTLSSPKQMCLA